MNELEKMKQGMLYDFSAPEPQQSHIVGMEISMVISRSCPTGSGGSSP